LRCIECGRETADGKGWRAYIADLPEDDEPPSVVVYCPECALREFGPLARNT
jgi:hypothetical protein